MQDLPRYFELTRFALIEITGNEAFAFLHRQIAGDLNDINSRGWMFSPWCQANGRVICSFMVFRHNQSLFLILPATMRDRIIRRLNMYVLRSDVRIRDVSDDHLLLGLHDINMLDTDFFGPGAKTGDMLVTATCSVINLWGPKPRCLVICKNDSMARVIEKIQRVCKKSDDSGWVLLDIEAGIPWITEATSEAFLPQMLNFDLMQGLSYQKGCYPGQEVIARLHYRGELKRKMYLGTGQNETAAAPGAVLERTDTGARAGDVIDAIGHPDGGFRLLAVAGINEASVPLRLQGEPQTSIMLQELHYPGHSTA